MSKNNDFKVKKGINVNNGKLIVNDEETTIDGVAIANQNYVDEQVGNVVIDNGVDELTSDEVNQLRNIDTTTISVEQWEYVGSQDQSLTTTDDVNFGRTSSSSVVDVVSTVNHEEDFYDYTLTTAGSSTYAQVGTKQQLLEDDGEILYTLPFTFTFYGVDYTQLKFGTNGAIMLGPDGDASAYDKPVSIDDFTVGPFITPFQMDLVAAPSVGSFTVTNGGSGYTNGTYNGVVGTNSRTGETISDTTVIISSGSVTAVNYWNAAVDISGPDWQIGDTITFNIGDIGGTGEGLVVEVSDAIEADLYIQDNGTNVVFRWHVYEYGADSQETDYIQGSVTLFNDNSIAIKFGDSFVNSTTTITSGINDGIGLYTATPYNNTTYNGPQNDVVFNPVGTRDFGTVSKFTVAGNEVARIDDTGTYVSQSGGFFNGSVNTESGYAMNNSPLISAVGVDNPKTSVSIGYGAGRPVNGVYNFIYGYDAGLSIANGGNNSIFIGQATGLRNTTGQGNTFLGNTAGTSNISGHNNVAIGSNSQRYNILGSYNTAVGFNSLSGLSGGTLNNGNYNVGIGYGTGTRIDSGTHNTYIGRDCGYNNRTGSHNITLGYQAGYGPLVTTGYEDNIFIGRNSGYSVQNDAVDNIALGRHSLYSITNGDINVAVGSEAGVRTTTGSRNVFLGQYAGRANTTGTDNIVLGTSAYGHVSIDRTGWHNIVMGSNAMSQGGGQNTYNIAMGFSSMSSCNGADNNVAIGFQTLFSNTTGDNNVAIGYNVLQNAINPSLNVAIGYTALSVGTNVTNCIAIGQEALFGSPGQTHSNNVGIGFEAGKNITSGTNNTILGNQAGNNMSNGTGNVSIGYLSDSHGASINYGIAIGSDAVVTNTDSFAIGRSSRTSGLRSMSFGAQSSCTHTDSVVFGLGCDSQFNNTFHLGETTGTVLDLYVSGDVTIASTTSATVPTGNSVQVAGSIGLSSHLNMPKAATIYHGDETYSLWGLPGHVFESQLIGSNGDGDLAGWVLSKGVDNAQSDFSELYARLDVNYALLHFSRHNATGQYAGTVMQSNGSGTSIIMDGNNTANTISGSITMEVADGAPALTLHQNGTDIFNVNNSNGVTIRTDGGTSSIAYVSGTGTNYVTTGGSQHGFYSGGSLLAEFRNASSMAVLTGITTLSTSTDLILKGGTSSSLGVHVNDKMTVAGVLSLTNALAPTEGGTGLSTIGSAGQVLTINSGGTAPEWSNPSSKTYVVPSDGANITAVAWEHYIVDTSVNGANITLTLPSTPSVGDEVGVTDMKGTFANGGTQNVVTASADIDGISSTTYELNVAGTTVLFVWTGTIASGNVGWKSIITQP